MKSKLLTLAYILLIIAQSINAQVRLKSNNVFAIGDDPTKHGTISIGYGNNLSVANNGRWGIESWDGGLNFFIPWPNRCIGYGDYRLFINDTTGNVGIGKKPSFKLDVDGDIATYGTLRISSDARLKSNIMPLNNCMLKINMLNGKSYIKNSPQIISAATQNSEFIKAQGKYKPKSEEIQLGLLAQDVKEVFPELVKKDSSGYLTVDYIGLIPVLVEAVKDLNKEVEALKQENEKLKKKVGLN
jgi:hypothetical protein